MSKIGSMFYYRKMIDNKEQIKGIPYINFRIDDRSSNNPIELTTIPPTPIKGTYNKSATKYAVILINNFLYKLLNPFTIMNIPGFNKLTTKFYSYSKDKKPIAFSIKNEDTIIICFRGSQTLTDFIDDAFYNYYNPIRPAGQKPFQEKPEKQIYSSPGFTGVYNEPGIKVDIISNVNIFMRQNYKKKRIFICGHSLGSSLSFLLAKDLGQLYPNTVEVYGIATPKTGDIPFASSVQNNCNYTLSLINLADIVPSIVTSYMYNKVPPQIPCSFAHVEPIAIFNNIQSDIESCHLINAYYKGVTNIIQPALIPNVINIAR
jgi:triacylglycerol lipase